MSRTSIQAADHALLRQAYTGHCERCPTGAAILTAIATTAQTGVLR